MLVKRLAKGREKNIEKMREKRLLLCISLLP
jgi:hypothetical protein